MVNSKGRVVKLIGMLDSPYVRRVAISLQLLGLRFEHQSLSVFRGFDEFRLINPVVKAPTLVCDDGTVLLDSTLILAYAEALARPRSLVPTGVLALQRELRLTGLALAACEKAVQIVYERTGQLLAAFGALEAEWQRQPLQATTVGLTQAGVSTAVAWEFTQQTLPGLVPEVAHPALVAFSAAAEALPAFRAAPHGDGTCTPAA